MTQFNNEQMLAANKANVQSLFDLTQKAIAGVEQLVELNLQVAKAALSDVQGNAQAALSVKDAQELLALQQSMLQPAAEKAVAYGRQVYDILAASNAEVTRLAEAQIAGAQQAAHALVDNAVKNAPAGTENVVGMLKTAMTAANQAAETAQKAVKQATQMAEANVQAMTSQAVKATQAATKGGKRGA